jgi:hypothetical protein
MTRPSYIDPVLDAVSREIAALAVQMTDIRRKMQHHARLLETHRLELVRLQRALARTRQTAPLPRPRPRPALGAGQAKPPAA